jgi:molecular chaperone GrpE (heat shock protein)
MKITDEFASAMQELSAEAETSLPPRASDRIEAQLGQMLKEFRALHSRVAKVEDALIAATEKLSTASMAAPHVVSQLGKLDDQLSALRESESVNHRLFDTLHDELIRYRDNFLHESLQKPFIRDLVILFDDLSGIASQLDATDEASGARPKTRQNLENALHSLVEILHRLEVTEIEPKERVDRALHRVISYEPADFPEEDGQIIMRVKRGFLWRDKVLRPEEVVAKRME